MSSPWLALFGELRVAAEANPILVALRDEVLAGQRGAPWTVIDGMLLFYKIIYVPASSTILPSILSALHEEGHEGVQKMLHRLKADFHVLRAQQLIQEFIRDCGICQ